MTVGDIVPAVVARRRRRHDSAARRRPARHDRQEGLRLDAARRAGTQLVTRGDLVEARLLTLDAGRAHRHRHARAAARRRGRGPRDRQSHRADQGDGRRLQLRAQQVQPRDAGVPPGRLGVQADRLHRRDRSRLHADHDADGHAGRASRRRRLSRRTRRRTTTASSGPGHAAPRARAVAQRAGGPGDGAARAPSRSSPTRAASGSSRRCRRTSPSRSAPRKRR